jgi:hypothetical protein
LQELGDPSKEALFMTSRRSRVLRVTVLTQFHVYGCGRQRSGRVRF